MLWQVVLASVIVSLISLVAIFVILRGTEWITRSLKSLVGIASGVLLASVFLELLPEIFEEAEFDAHTFFLVMLLSILGFYLIERFVHWHHCHGTSCPPETKMHVAVTNLIGDGIHNFIDGILIGAAFLVSPSIGVATTMAIIAHEIPQEISDASILIFAGLSKAKVIGFNLLFAFTAVIGAVLAFFFVGQFEYLLPIFVAIAAGNFLYLALADLIPELHHDQDPRRVVRQVSWLLLGVVIFWLIGQIFSHG